MDPESELGDPAARLDCVADQVTGWRSLRQRSCVERIYEDVVSRKNLPLIHLVPTKMPSHLYVFQPLHESVEFLYAAALRCKLFEPIAE
jgi:hypothetical protein